MYISVCVRVCRYICILASFNVLNFMIVVFLHFDKLLLSVIPLNGQECPSRTWKMLS